MDQAIRFIIISNVVATAVAVVRPVIASNEVTYIKMRLLDHTARQKGRKKERRKGRGIINIIKNLLTFVWRMFQLLTTPYVHLYLKIMDYLVQLMIPFSRIN